MIDAMQVALAPDPERLQAPVKEPAPVLANVTVPVGVVTAVLFKSVTVAVHDEPLPTSTEDGAHVTLVEVERIVTVTVADCAPELMLQACDESPP